MVCRTHLGAKMKPNSWRLQKEIAGGYEIRDLTVTAENGMTAAVKQFSSCTKQQSLTQISNQKHKSSQSKRREKKSITKAKVCREIAVFIKSIFVANVKISCQKKGIVMKVWFFPCVFCKILKRIYFAFWFRWPIMTVTVLDSVEKMGQAEMGVLES